MHQPEGKLRYRRSRRPCRKARPYKERMSAETFFGGAVQLADLPGSGIAAAPFPVLKEVRKRSSSLGAAQYCTDQRQVHVLFTRASDDAGAVPAVDSEMPGLWRSSSKKVSQNEAGSAQTAGGVVHGNRQKITKEGRERRLSSAGVLAHLRLSSPASAQKQEEGQRVRSKTASNASQSKMVIDGASSNKISQEDAVVRQFDADVPNQGGPLYASTASRVNGNRDSSSSSEDEDEAVTEQRAKAYAALTGNRPSPGNTAARIRATSMLTKATHSQPARVPIRPGAVASSSAIPRRRTTSSNDAPTMAERSSKSPAIPSSSVFNVASALSGSKLPRTRVQSANNAQSGPSASRHSPSTGSPSPAATRRKRRSLSQENSLVATRLARAFLARELGETAISRRPANAPREAWSIDESEQRELWLALHDGVVLCR